MKYPLRSVCRLMVESFWPGSAPVTASVEPLTATVGGLPCCMEVDTVRWAVPVYARSRVKLIVQVPALVCA